MTDPTSSYPYSIRILGRNYTIVPKNALLFIVVLAIILRLLSALLQGDAVTELPGIYDQVSYDSLASRVVGGYGFTFAENHWPMTRAGEPTAHWSYLYTLFLAAVYALFGHHPVIARILQAVLVGGLQTYLTFLIAEKIFSKSVGILAAGLSAVYIYFIYYGGALMTEPFYITAILWSLFLSIRIAETEERRKNIQLGVALGIAIAITIILRQVFLLFLPFLFLWMWIARLRRHLSLPLVATVLSMILIALCVFPISLYNHARFGRFVLLNTNSGYAFFWGNHPIYGTHFIPILPSETYQSLIPEELRNLDEAALDQALLKRGMQFVFDDPKRYILLSISRVPAYFMFWPSSDSSLVSNISRVASFGIAFPFMLLGMFLSGKRNRFEKGNYLLNVLASHLGLLILFVVIYSSVHLLTWALIRYRLPIDAILIPFAAFALLNIWEWVTKKQSAATVIPSS